MMKRFGLVLILAAACLLFVRPALAQAQARALVLTADGMVAPAMKEYILRGIETAQDQGYNLLVI